MSQYARVLHRDEVAFRCEACREWFTVTYRKPQRSHRFCFPCKKKRHRQQALASYYRRSAEARAGGPIEIGQEIESNPVYPLLVDFVNHQCRVHLALAAVRTGHYEDAIAALEDEVA